MSDAVSSHPAVVRSALPPHIISSPVASLALQCITALLEAIPGAAIAILPPRVQPRGMDVTVNIGENGHLLPAGLRPN